jgi:hypothetical protein
MKLQVLNPVAQKVEGKGSSAARLSKLEGKHIGLYWNFKAGGDAALKRAGELLKSRFPDLDAKIYTGSIGGSNHFVTTDDAKRIAQECAAVIGSTAD